MTSLLHVHASPRGSQSISRALAEVFLRNWRVAHPDGEIIERDLMLNPVPYMDLAWIGGVYAPSTVERTSEMTDALDLSSVLIDEVQRANHILISTPMYNFTIPAVLKSWVDYIIRPGFTFALKPGWPGLLDNKPTRVLIAARDDHLPGSDDDQVTPVLRRAFAFMGVRDLISLVAGNSLSVNRGEIPLADHVARFEESISRLARDIGAARMI